jgi:hypothetical protein
MLREVDGLLDMAACTEARGIEHFYVGCGESKGCA